MARHYPTTGALAAVIAVLAFAAAGAPGGTALAQDMEPRAYATSPVGMNFVVVGAGNTQGAILFDPTVPIADADADLNLGVAGYARTFAMGGRQALIAGGFSYARGDLSGVVQGEPRRVGRSGMSDMRAKLSVNLVGPGAMTLEEFAKTPHRTVLGVSLTVQAPTGQYYDSKLINIGNNRWAFKPEIGVSVPVGRWFLDAYAGVWLFTTNDAFYPGESKRTQDPLYTAQGHVSYTFRNRSWLAFDTTWYTGGASTVDDGEPSTRQNTTRVGGTFSMPLTRRQSVKLTASTGASARTGSDFDTVLVAWQIGWFDRPSAPNP